jgi:hypothetical protein
MTAQRSAMILVLPSKARYESLLDPTNSVTNFFYNADLRKMIIEVQEVLWHIYVPTKSVHHSVSGVVADQIQRGR